MGTEQGPVCMKQIQIKFHTEVEDKTEILIKPTFFNIKNAFNKAKAQKTQTNVNTAAYRITLAKAVEF